MKMIITTAETNTSMAKNDDILLANSCLKKRLVLSPYCITNGKNWDSGNTVPNIKSSKYKYFMVLHGI